MRADKQHTDIRQEQIALAALAVVGQYGLRRLSIGAIARRVGLVPSAIYRHYKSKDAVVDAVLELVGDRLVANVEAVRQERDDALARLRLLLGRHLSLILDNAAIPQIVFSEEVYAKNAKRRARLFKMVQKYLARVAEIVRDGQQAGQVRASVDPDTAALMFLGLVQPLALLWRMSDGQFDVVREADRTWALFSEVLTTR